MSFLTGIQIRKEIDDKRILIESLINETPFDAKRQVTEESIDLRLYPKILRQKEGIEEIDILVDDLSLLYDEFQIGKEGFLLSPGQVVIGQTLEAITLPPDLVGFVFTRMTYALLGVEITCGAHKFASGITWAFPLQIRNSGSASIRIYSFAVVAQMVVSRMVGVPIGYPPSGHFYGQYNPTTPYFNEREKTFLRTMTKATLSRTSHIEDKIQLAKASAIASMEEGARHAQIFRNLMITGLGAISASLIAYSIMLMPAAGAAPLTQKDWMLVGAIIVIASMVGGIAIFMRGGGSSDGK